MISCLNQLVDSYPGPRGFLADSEKTSGIRVVDSVLHTKHTHETHLNQFLGHQSIIHQRVTREVVSICRKGNDQFPQYNQYTRTLLPNQWEWNFTSKVISPSILSQHHMTLTHHKDTRGLGLSKKHWDGVWKVYRLIRLKSEPLTGQRSTKLINTAKIMYFIWFNNDQEINIWK